MKNTQADPPQADAKLVLLSFAVAYVAALVFFSDAAYDRYLLPLLPVFIIFLLLLSQPQIRSKILMAGSLCLLVLTFYGVATTHDYLAASRARAAAAAFLEAKGIPRTAISAGLEYDCWTELRQSGHIPPPQQGFRLPPPAAGEENYWLWPVTPHVQPKYFVVYARQPHLSVAPFQPFPYLAWLPPFHREVLIETLPSLTATRSAVYVPGQSVVPARLARASRPR